MKNEIYGARAIVYIKYKGDIYSLADKLSESLIIKNLDIETDEYPPHNLVGMFEGYGFEGWLERSEGKTNDFDYVFRMETLDCFEEIAGNRMYNLSPWLARLICTLCKLEALPELA